MKILFVSNLFPDAACPGHGQINAQVLHQLAPHCEIRVISPRPMLPFKSWRGRVPREEDRDSSQFTSARSMCPSLAGPGTIA